MTSSLGTMFSYRYTFKPTHLERKKFDCFQQNTGLLLTENIRFADA